MGYRVFAAQSGQRAVEAVTEMGNEIDLVILDMIMPGMDGGKTFDRIREIHARIPNTHLVMHGSSSVPQDWLEIINSYGGDMGQTYGVPVEEIQEGIKNGVAKVNIDTDLRMASTGSIRKHLAENTSNFDPRKFLKESTAGMKAICKARYEAFGCAGNASKITPISLEKMVDFYK